MVGDFFFVEPYGPFPIEVLAYEDLTFGEASAVFPRWDIDDESAEPYTVIVSDSCFVSECDGVVDLFF